MIKKKQIVIKMMICCFVTFMLWNVDVRANEYQRRNEIKSKGAISFEQGKVYITANDFLYLADKIDDLEKTYKRSLINAINQLNVYFKNDGTIVYDRGRDEVDTDEEKGKFSFEHIKNGILKSQSVESLYNVQAVDQNGKPLYYINEAARNNMEYLNTTTNNTGYPLFYKEANTGSMSAGCAAWVNGVLLKGTGADNRTSWNNGYNEGYSKGVADALGKINVVYTYHSHTGNISQVGGCYGNLTGTKEVICGCTSYIYDSFMGHARCANCYHNHGSKCEAVTSHEPYTYIGLICGKTEQTIESATIIY